SCSTASPHRSARARGCTAVGPDGGAHSGRPMSKPASTPSRSAGPTSRLVATPISWSTLARAASQGPAACDPTPASARRRRDPYKTSRPSPTVARIGPDGTARDAHGGGDTARRERKDMMKRTATAFAVTAAAGLVLAGCSSADEEPTDDAATGSEGTESEAPAGGDLTL